MIQNNADLTIQIREVNIIHICVPEILDPHVAEHFNIDTLLNMYETPVTLIVELKKPEQGKQSPINLHFFEKILSHEKIGQLVFLASCPHMRSILHLLKLLHNASWPVISTLEELNLDSTLQIFPERVGL